MRSDLHTTVTVLDIRPRRRMMSRIEYNFYCLKAHVLVHLAKVIEETVIFA